MVNLRVNGLLLAILWILGFAELSVFAQQEPRLWKDQSGDFEVTAVLESANETTVSLRRGDKVTEIEINRLSTDDQIYIRSYLDQQKALLHPEEVEVSPPAETTAPPESTNENTSTSKDLEDEQFGERISQIEAHLERLGIEREVTLVFIASMAVGSLLSFACWILLILNAFSKNPLWGLLVVVGFVFPPLLLVFIICCWKEAKPAVVWAIWGLILLVGPLLIVLGIGLVPEEFLTFLGWEPKPADSK